jgi:alanine racemase
MCNSGGSDWFRASFCNAVRIGRRLYMDNQAEPLTPGTPGAVQEACSWRASVTNLRVVEAGDTVGYDAAWTAPRRTRVATVCVGYGDGLYYPLAEAGGPLLVGEQRARLLATCMDQCFVDVTDIPCRAGDEVTFFGQSSGGAAMPIQELGKFMHVEGVYFYSFLSPRVARVYEGLEP